MHRMTDTAENDALTDYEVWRSGPNLKARDVRLYFGLNEQQAQESLDFCYGDKAEGYPDALIEFYVMRVTRTRVSPPGSDHAQG